MAEARRGEHTANPLRRQGGRYIAAPGEVIQLLDLREIEFLWGFTEKRVYGAVARGEVRAYGRPGRQKYYSRAELIATFGEPKNGHLPPAKRERTDRGSNQQSFERLIAEAA
jgi:hypothetical protein